MSSQRDTATSTEQDSSIHNAPHGQQLVLVDTIGRMGLIVLLFVAIVLIGFAFLVGRWDGIGEARAENLSTQIRTLNARVEVIQWEFDKASAQLIEKGLITPPE